MCETWIEAYEGYGWTVDLAKFKESAKYPMHFNRVVTPADTMTFEDQFRAMIDKAGSFEIAGEVCFWKNYGSFQSRNRITQRLLRHLETPENWDAFVKTLKRVSESPSFGNFRMFREACDQPKGFATPITFLAFYNPTGHPMADKHIADWWVKNKVRYGFDASPIFSQRNDGWIQTYTHSQDLQNWNAYLAWTRFCRNYAQRVSAKCGVKWRARDVEMAVWEAQKRGIRLNILQQIRA